MDDQPPGLGLAAAATGVVVVTRAGQPQHFGDKDRCG
jgi:hypothetical protein